MSINSPSNRPQRLVIIRPSALGDVCRTVPILASLRAGMPDAHLAWVVQDDFAPAIEAHPALDEVIAFPRTRLARWWSSPGALMEARSWFISLRQRRFDVAIDCQGLGRSGLIARATGAPLRIGLTNAREFAWLGYNRRVHVSSDEHTVDRMLALLKPLSVEPLADMRLYVPPSGLARWSQLKTTLNIGEQPYAVLAPGSRWPSKRWPIERFSDLIEPLLARGFSRIVVLGSPSERSQIQPLFDRYRTACTTGREDRSGSSAAPIIDLVGQTSIADTMAVISDSSLVVANDSAPLHMAVGFDRPCVALFGPTDPATVGPYARVECVVRAYQPKPGQAVNYKSRRLGDSLMRLISTSLVLQTTDRVLAMWNKRQSPAVASSRIMPSTVSQADRASRTDSRDLPHGLSRRAVT